MAVETCPECGVQGFTIGCATCDARTPEGDGGLYGAQPEAKILDPQAIIRLGALTLQEESSEAVQRLLIDQEETYEEVLKKRGARPLIAALLARDQQLAGMGREMASLRSGSRLLREFVRGVLTLSDHAGLRAVGDGTKAGKIEQILQALGAEPADLRQLKMHGSTLGDAGPTGESK